MPWIANTGLPEQKQFLEQALSAYEELARDTGQEEMIRAGVAQAHLRVGYIRKRLGLMKEAEAAFKGVIRLNPDDYQAYGNLGIICMRDGRLEKAEQYFQAAIRLNPDDTVARQNLEALVRSKPAEKKN